MAHTSSSLGEWLLLTALAGSMVRLTHGCLTRLAAAEKSDVVHHKRVKWPVLAVLAGSWAS